MYSSMSCIELILLINENRTESNETLNALRNNVYYTEKKNKLLHIVYGIVRDAGCRACVIDFVIGLTVLLSHCHHSYFDEYVYIYNICIL